MNVLHVYLPSVAHRCRRDRWNRTIFDSFGGLHADQVEVIAGSFDEVVAHADRIRKRVRCRVVDLSVGMTIKIQPALMVVDRVDGKTADMTVDELTTLARLDEP